MNVERIEKDGSSSRLKTLIIYMWFYARETKYNLLTNTFATGVGPNTLEPVCSVSFFSSGDQITFLSGGSWISQKAKLLTVRVRVSHQMSVSQSVRQTAVMPL